MALVHTFKKANATTRVPTAVDGFTGHGQAPGGFTDATAVISQAEFDAFPTFYAYGVEWIVTNPGDPVEVLTANQSSVETDIAPWQATSGCTVAQSAAHALNGTKSLFINPAGGVDATWRTRLPTAANANGQNIPVVAGISYRVGFYLKHVFVGFTPVRSARVSVTWYDAAFVSISSDVGSYQLFSGWTQITHETGPAPAGAAYMTLTGRVELPADSDEFYMDVASVLDLSQGRVVWAGTLDDPQVVGGIVTLHADGPAKKADKLFNHWLWQTRDESQWSPGDQTPFNYDADQQIEARVVGRELRWKVAHGTPFKKKAGVPASWSTPLVFPAPEVDINRIAFTIDKERVTSEYTLEILRATFPSGALTSVSDLPLSTGSPTTIDLTIPNNPDQIVARLKRTSETKKSRGFRLRLKDVRVNGMAVGDDYKTHQVALDIAGKLGGTTTGIQTSTRNAMPLDVEDASAGEVLDELALLDDWYWGIEHDGTNKAWKYQPWDTKTWVLTEARSPVSLLPLPRYGKVRIPFRYPGGVRRFKTYTATGAPATADTYQLDLDDPLPTEEIVDILGPNIAEYLWDTRFFGQATFLEVEDLATPGVKVSASRVRMGDRLKLSYYSDRTLRVSEVGYEDASSSDDTKVLCTASFPEHHPLVERLTRRRKLMLARGRGQARATLSGLGLAEPLAPVLTVGFEEQEVRGGRRAFNGVIDWATITEDVEGNATAIRRYYIERRPVDASDVVIPRAQGGGRKGMWIKDPDGGLDDVPTQALFEKLAHPHKWKWQFQGYSEDVLGKMSAPSGWSTAVKPAAFGPPDPTGLAVKLQPKRDRIVGEWNADDPSENDTDGSPVLDRRIAYFEVRLRRRLKANPGDPFVTYRGPRKVGKRTEFAFKDIAQMGRYRWRYQVRSGDAYGNTTAWT